MKTDRRQRRLNILFAIIIAFTSWIYVIYTMDPSTTKTIKAVPVEYTSQRDLAVSELALKSTDTETVDVKVEGKRSVIGRISADDIRATVNLADAGKGENVIDIILTSPNNISVTNKGNERATVVIENLAYKEVRSRVEYTDSVEQSIEPYVTEQSDDVYMISGAESLVDKVEYVSIPLTSDKVGDEEKTFSLKNVAMDSSHMPVNYITIDPAITSVSVVNSTVKTVDLSIDIDIPENDYYQVTYNSPTSVAIKGSPAALAKVASISTMPISTEGMTESQDIPIEYVLPEGIQVANASKDEVVHIKVIPYTSKTITVPTSRIQIMNLGSAYTANFEDDTITIEVTGLEKSIRSLTAADFNLSVSVKDLEEGTYQPELKIDTDALIYKVEPIGGSPYITITDK